MKNNYNNDSVTLLALKQEYSRGCEFGHKQCIKVCKMMINLMDANVDIDVDNFLELLNYFIVNDNGKNSWHSNERLCTHKCREDITNIFNRVMSKHAPTTTLLIVIMEAKFVGLDIMYYIKKYHKDDMIDNMIINDIIKSNNGELLTSLVDNFSDKFSDKNIMFLIENDKIQLCRQIFTSTKINPTNQLLEKILSVTKYGGTSEQYSLINELFLAGLVPSHELLVMACKYKNVKTVQFLLENKVIPDKECYQSIFSGNKDYRSLNDIIDLLIKCGYCLDYDDVVIATKHSTEIKNIERFDIKFKNDFMEICSTYNFYPKYKTNIPIDVSILVCECKKSGNITQIRKIIASGIVPNITCLEEACKHKNNLQVIKLLISKGIKPNTNCIINMARSLHNSSLNFLLSQYNPEIQMQQTQQPSKQENTLDVNNKNINKDDKDDKDIKEDEDEDEDDDDEEAKEDKDESKKTIKTIEPEKKFDKYIVVPPTEVIGQKASVKTNTKLTKMFGIKAKETDFITVRKKFFEYINKHKLCDPDNKLYIKIDKHMNTSLGLGKSATDKYLYFTDIDNFLYNAMSNK